LFESRILERANDFILKRVLPAKVYARGDKSAYLFDEERHILLAILVSYAIDYYNNPKANKRIAAFLYRAFSLKDHLKKEADNN